MIRSIGVLGLAGRLQFAAVLAALSVPSHAWAQTAVPHAGATCRGGIGGVADLGPDASVVFTAKSDSTGARLIGAVVVRGPAGWQTVEAGPRPELNRAGAGGGAVGPYWILIDEDASAPTVRIDSRAVSLGSANVLLVTIDSLGATPRPVGSTTIPAHLTASPDGCFRLESLEALRAALARDPIVRAFYDH